MAQLATGSDATAAQRRTGDLVRDGLLVVNAVLMAVTLYLVFFYVPTDANLGVSQRIF